MTTSNYQEFSQAGDLTSFKIIIEKEGYSLSINLAVIGLDKKAAVLMVNQISDAVHLKPQPLTIDELFGGKK